MKYAAAMLLCSLIGSCGWLPNHYLDYRNAKAVKPLSMPPDMPFIGEQPLYPVPDVPAPEYGDDRKDEPPEPPQLAVLGRDLEEEEPPLPDGAQAPDPTQTRVLMARDGNGYPIIMMHSPFTWAWEYVSQALARTDLKIDDRDRESGIFYVKTPRKYDVDGNEAQIKLSHTVNGIQIAVLNRKGSALLDKEPGQQIIQKLYDKL